MPGPDTPVPAPGRSRGAPGAASGPTLRYAAEFTLPRGGSPGERWNVSERIRGRIRRKGVNPFILVPPASIARLSPDWKRPMPVRFRVNAIPPVPWRLNLMPAGDGSFYLYLNGEVRSATRTKVGDPVEVELERDGEYRSGPAHPMPPELATGLQNRPGAARRWENLPPSLQKEVLRYLARLRSAEARERNVQRALRVLGGSRERFLGRLWNDDPGRYRRS